jgi:cytochrome c oxidase subunit 2
MGVAFVLMAGALAAVFLMIGLEARTEPWDATYARAGVIRRWWFRGLLVFAVVVFGISLTWLPYQAARAQTIPGDANQVAVTASQFQFDLASTCIPEGQPVEFNVTSKDVNHGFAIYDEDGRIVGQTQAMPGFTNVLRMRFDTPGTYTLHCDELCGPGHPFMTGTFKVGDCGSGGATGGSTACGGC